MKLYTFRGGPEDGNVKRATETQLEPGDVVAVGDGGRYILDGWHRDFTDGARWYGTALWTPDAPPAEPPATVVELATACGVGGLLGLGALLAAALVYAFALLVVLVADVVSGLADAFTFTTSAFGAGAVLAAVTVWRSPKVIRDADQRNRPERKGEK